jgi:hypothetical protein
MDEVVVDQLVVYAIHLVGVSELKTEPKCVIDKKRAASLRAARLWDRIQRDSREMSSSTRMLAAENYSSSVNPTRNVT